MIGAEPLGGAPCGEQNHDRTASGPLPVRGAVRGPRGMDPSRQKLDSSVLIAVDRGRFGIAVGAQRFFLGPRQALLLPENIRHAGFATEGDEPPVYYWVHFQSGRGTWGDAVSLPVSALDLSEMTYSRLATCFHQLINERSTGRNNAILCDYMLSVAPGYSEDYLSRLFHESVDCSFRQYIHRLRMQRATRELLCSVKTIQQIAAECGYSNAKFFSTAFLKCEGISPSAYRNMYGGIHQNNA